jgi:hypothetical protein
MQELCLCVTGHGFKGKALEVGIELWRRGIIDKLILAILCWVVVRLSGKAATLAIKLVFWPYNLTSSFFPDSRVAR